MKNNSYHNHHNQYTINFDHYIHHHHYELHNFHQSTVAFYQNHVFFLKKIVFIFLLTKFSTNIFRMKSSRRSEFVGLRSGRVEAAAGFADASAAGHQ